MYNVIKKRQETLHADKESAPAEKSGSKLSDAELYTHHKALAGHYRALANEQKAGDSGGINPGAESDEYAGDESAYETESGGSAGELTGGDLSGESLEDATGQQESAAYEKSESPEQESLEDLGEFQGAGGSLRNAKEEEPTSREKGPSRFEQFKKKKKARY